jgi:hypothetical protein
MIHAFSCAPRVGYRLPFRWLVSGNRPRLQKSLAASCLDRQQEEQEEEVPVALIASRVAVRFAVRFAVLVATGDAYNYA